MSNPVYLVGAGCGHAGLLTAQARDVLTSYAEIVVRDRLIGSDVLSLIPPHVEQIFAGKSCKHHHMTQDQIQDLLLEHAMAGRKVVRLKGGDPFIYGRGGEEADFLRIRGIEVRIIPGISAHVGAAAELSIPLTHREHSSGLYIFTAHQVEALPDFAHFTQMERAGHPATFVYYMGLSRLGEVTRAMIDGGFAGDTPCVAVSNATLPEMRHCFATLDTLAGRVEEMGLISPTIIIIGRCVALSPLWRAMPTTI